MSGESKHGRDPAANGESRLAQALAVHARYVAGEEGEDPAQLVARHPDLRDLLEPMLETRDTASDASRSAPVAMGGTEHEQIGDFRLLREIGRGGMGVVWEAEQLSLGRRVALKLLSPVLLMDPVALARFHREASLAASLDHPGVTKVLAFSAEPDLAFLAMELVDGRPLADVLVEVQDEMDPRAVTPERWASAASHSLTRSKSETRPVPSRGIDIVVDWIIDVAEALNAAHAVGVVHRDVKPSNILIRASNLRAVLTDFGLARETNSLGVTRTGEFAGTVCYSSPEQLSGRSTQQIDARTDVFALGVTAYKALTFSHPFVGHTLAQIQTQIERSEPTDPRRLNADIDRDLAAVLSRALEKDPNRRYLTAGAFAEDLQRWRRLEPVVARPVSTVHRLTRWGRRNPLASTFLVFAFGALIAVTALAVSANSSAAEATAALADFDDLAIGERLSLLERDVAKLTTTRAHAAPLRSALDEAERLVDTLPRLTESLSALRRRGTQPSDRRSIETHPLASRFESLREERTHATELSTSAEAEAWQLIDETRKKRDEMLREELDPLAEQMESYRRFVFENPRDQLLHDRLEDVASQLLRFRDDKLQDLRTRVEWTVDLQHDQPPAEWEACNAAVRAEPRYSGIEFGPQEGLTPLGPDPRSGLHEFAHRRTGERIPGRNADGTLHYGEDCGIVFVLIPAGVVKPIPLIVGNRQVLSPQIDVKPYFLSKFEMSRRQWRRIAEHVPHLRQITKRLIRGEELDGRKPVIFTDWSDANELMQREGLALPTVAQWLWAARHTEEWGTSAHVWDGGGTGPIDSMAPNPFGLHNVLGHVAEWCADSMTNSYPGGGVRGRLVPYLPLLVRATVGRGYLEDPSFRPGDRAMHDRAWNLGLRPARALDQQ